ncbi:MAG: hypothetical protein WCY53_03785 [Sphaerochaetaceae bacterium]
MKRVLISLFVLISLVFSVSAALNTSTLTISGTIESKSILDLSNIIGGGSGGDSVRLDSGDILYSASGFGSKVGSWYVSSNSSADLKLVLMYPNDYKALDGKNGIFTAVVNEQSVAIPYKISNGAAFLEHGDNFAQLVKINGVYKEESNNGSVYIKRIDDETYPPFSGYETIIQLVLETL